MKELGRILKTARESKGLTLDELQERTKIRKRYLQAIEDGELSIMPGLVYARGFIKSYAEQVGLDGQALLQDYGLTDYAATADSDANKSEGPTADKIKEVPQLKRKSHNLEEKNRIFPQVVMTIAVIGLLGVGLWFLSNREAAPEPPKGQPQTTTPPPGQQNEQVPTQPSEQQKPAEPLKPEAKENGRSIYKVDGDEIKLELATPNGDCWLEIKVDNVNRYSKLTSKGIKLSYVGTKEVVVVAGYSPALSITVNDRQVELDQVNGRYEFVFRK